MTGDMIGPGKRSNRALRGGVVLLNGLLRFHTLVVDGAQPPGLGTRPLVFRVTLRLRA